MISKKEIEGAKRKVENQHTSQILGTVGQGQQHSSRPKGICSDSLKGSGPGVHLLGSGTGIASASYFQHLLFGTVGQRLIFAGRVDRELPFDSG